MVLKNRTSLRAMSDVTPYWLAAETGSGSSCPAPLAELPCRLFAHDGPVHERVDEVEHVGGRVEQA
jgi:hypothetical protein